MKQPIEMPQTKSFLTLLFGCFSMFLLGQQDFNNFQTLVSEGPIPADFKNKTSVKIDTDYHSGRVKMSSTSTTKKYLEAIHSSIDEMLMSGYVVYGDEVSEYVKAVAENLLKNDPELSGKFRYYTIKSNETNALSTDQGIIFVTTGLISQLKSEAQLAFVLAHEISHYTEKHVQSNYQERLKNINKWNRIERMSSYSKELEFEADSLALRLYNAAGYSIDEIVPTFDVLMYSYLPFDNVAFPKDYFNNELVYVPNDEFGTKTYPIKKNENYDDDLSSHPNIRKRKDAIDQALRPYSEWDSQVYIFGQDKFTYIRNVARFESLRSNIIDAQLCQALYSIFLLEREFPNSNYLKRMKALTWLSLMQLNAEGDVSKILPETRDLEGESGILYYFIKNLKSKEIAALGLREINDLQHENPEDAYLKLVFERAIKASAKTETFKLKEFNSKTLKDQAAEYKATTEKNSVADSVQTSKSKYDKIKSKTDINASKAVDSADFAIYILPDIIQNPEFLKSYNKYKVQQDSVRSEKEAFEKLTLKEKRQVIKEANAIRTANGIDLKKFVLVEPTVEYTKGYRYSAEYKENASTQFEASITSASEKAGLEMTIVSKQGLENGKTTIYNERNAYFSFLNQASNYQGVDIFPVDFERLKEYTSKRGTSNILFTTAEYDFAPNLNPMVYIGSVILFPTLPITLLIYTPIKLIRGNTTDYSTIVFDTNNGETITYKYNTIHSKPRSGVNQSYYQQLLNSLKSSKK